MNFVEPLMISSEGDSEHLFEIFSDAAAVLANKLKHIAENSVVQHLKLRNAAPLDAHEQTHTSEIECLSRMTQSLEVDHQSSHSGPV